MEVSVSNNIGENKLKEYYYKVCRILYAFGAPNYWYGDLGVPVYVVTIHNMVIWIIDLTMLVYFVSLFAANFTQPNLTEKQKSDQLVFSFSLPAWYIYIVVFNYYKEDMKILCHELIVKLKEKYNDRQVEKEMVKAVKMYCGTYVVFVCSAISLNGIYGVVLLIFYGRNFVALAPMWPDVLDTSRSSVAMRICHYLSWWIVAVRVISSAYLEAIMISICLSHQYKNLCSYFRSLNSIFENEEITQEEKHKIYEEAFILGIKHHNMTVRYKELAQKILYIVFSIQTFINIITITLLLTQLANSDRSLSNLLTVSVTLVAILIGTGSFWCSAGDVSVEVSIYLIYSVLFFKGTLALAVRIITIAAYSGILFAGLLSAEHLPTAMFESGWQHCRGRAAVRARSLLSIAMWHSQRPVEIKCLGLVPLSYSAYVKIARMSYQVFSVLYTR